MRTISWFSCGAASAVATKLSKPDVIAYCETGSEDKDNARFMRDCEEWFGQEIKILKNPRYESTWEVWEKKRYISGPGGAPCTKNLKIIPRLMFEEPEDLHIFGYTADHNDVRRYNSFGENWPDLTTKAPLIEAGLNKAACLAMVESAGIKPPRVYKMGFPNANCIPCCKASSPSYYALVRKEFPAEFDRFNKLCHELGCRPVNINGEHCFPDEVPENQPLTQPIAPECDFLCQLAEINNE
jgi:hypothetical protein